MQGQRSMELPVRLWCQYICELTEVHHHHRTWNCYRFIIWWRRGRKGLSVMYAVTEHQEINGIRLLYHCATCSNKSSLTAVNAAMTFMQIQNKRMLSIDQQLSIQRIATAQNRLKLRSIVKTIIFCGRRGISLRSHWDDHTCVDTDPLANHGNFLTLVQFRIQAGDRFLVNTFK